ncbi:LysR family transcriptional regulator [Sporosarcina sp. HYO08]|uniref:LysR family transcriptional regulator n=1 Tax=Sporosarcina sp. HYO08 TaxID=1759557 RepID=UPI000792029C|nr:LysR family transcriptional regulator [Sporosarcina sp. HYO08]KXH84157.1 LysR family transcriptional regulator [Sporosarcina sp. HYO08]
MEIKKIHYFVTIVDLMSFSKAAKKLHVSQPSLSKAIQDLEKEFGFPLIERNTRNSRLTEAGEVFYKRAIHLLNEVDVAKKEMDEVKLVGKGEIQLGMIESIKHWLPKVIVDYEEKFPAVKIRLTEVLSGEAVRHSLRSYETHAIITNQPIQEDDIETIPLYDEKLVVVFHHTHPLVNYEEVTLKQIADEPFMISAEGFQTRKDILHAFALEDAMPNIKYEFERFETALSLVRENLGIAIIPEYYLLGPKDSSIQSKKLTSSILDRTVYLTVMRNRFLSPSVKVLLQDIQDYFA